VKKPSTMVTTITVPLDVRAILDSWSAKNMTSMSSEIVRSVLERARRERQEAEAA